MTQHTTDPATTTRNAKKAQIERLEHNLSSHTVIGQPVLDIDKIRVYAKDLGRVIIERAPVSREQSMALTKLEEVVFWAVAAIARNQSGLTDDTPPV